MKWEEIVYRKSSGEIGSAKEIQKDLKKRLKPNRYTHTLGVVQTALHLATVYGSDASQAVLAALLHDCAKYMSDEDKITLCREYDVEISVSEYKNPSLLHAKCGAIRANVSYGVEDEEVLHAIRVHTTGIPKMNLLDKIIFISDYIEPNRDQAPHLEELRALADTDLDQTAYLILKDTVEYLNQRKDQVMDPTTLQAYKYYANLAQKRREDYE
ncbi:MAG: bis(5'-nucleosyl)-tetraphosphatase (symmetrical) YqeK [Eubacterium sp.]